MNNDPNQQPESAIVEVSKESEEIVKQDTSQETKTNDIQAETMALIDAIRLKAQSETQKVGEFTRQNYLDAVRQARQEVENRNFFKPEQVEDAVKHLQNEVEKNWDGLVKQVNSVGDRLQEAAKAAWDVLTKSEKD